jgi:hypothetical protein
MTSLLAKLAQRAAPVLLMPRRLDGTTNSSGTLWFPRSCSNVASKGSMRAEAGISNSNSIASKESIDRTVWSSTSQYE